MQLHLWSVSVDWNYRRKRHETKLNIVAYTLTEAAELGLKFIADGFELDGKGYDAAHIRRAEVVNVAKSCDIDAIATLRDPVPEPARKLADLDLSTRAQNILASLDIDTLKQLCASSREELLAARGSGVTTVDEIESALSRYGLSLDSGDESSDGEALARESETAE